MNPEEQSIEWQTSYREEDFWRELVLGFARGGSGEKAVEHANRVLLASRSIRRNTKKEWKDSPKEIIECVAKTIKGLRKEAASEIPVGNFTAFWVMGKVFKKASKCPEFAKHVKTHKAMRVMVDEGVKRGLYDDEVKPVNRAGMHGFSFKRMS